MNCTSGVRLEIKIKFGHQGFACLRQKFPKINEAKKKEGIFIGPQFTQIFTDQHFST
jgi:hypothetical protein